MLYLSKVKYNYNCPEVEEQLTFDQTWTFMSDRAFLDNPNATLFPCPHTLDNLLNLTVS